MLSRVADAVYWMNRYMERAENVARFIDVNLALMLDLEDGYEEQWMPLVATTGDEAWFFEHYDSTTRDEVMRFLALDDRYPNSILRCMKAARENARSVREIISSEMWEQINRAYLYMREAAADPEAALDTPHELLSEIKLAVQTFVGVAHVSMTHNEAWHFGRLGRLLERADKTSRIVDVRYFLLSGAPTSTFRAVDHIHWGALLKSASAMEMYRKQYRGIRPSRVIDFLLLDARFPRAVRRCLMVAQESLRAITDNPGADTEPERRLQALCEELEGQSADSIIEAGVHEYLDRLQSDLNGVGAAVFDTFLAVKPVGDAGLE
ncbi:MAG: alpha-E domain-containing protein [Myxococcota bacterium]